jgi:hypothetical protein
MKKKEKAKQLSKGLYWYCHFKKSAGRRLLTVTSIDSPVAHAAVFDVDLNIRQARCGASKLVLFENSAIVKCGEGESSGSFFDGGHCDLVCVFCLLSKDYVKKIVKVPRLLNEPEAKRRSIICVVRGRRLEKQAIRNQPTSKGFFLIGHRIRLVYIMNYVMALMKLYLVLLRLLRAFFRHSRLLRADERFVL